MRDFSWTGTFSSVDLSELPGMLILGAIALIALLWLAYGFCKAIDELNQNDWRAIEKPPKTVKRHTSSFFKKTKKQQDEGNRSW